MLGTNLMKTQICLKMLVSEVQDLKFKWYAGGGQNTSIRETNGE